MPVLPGGQGPAVSVGPIHVRNFLRHRQKLFPGSSSMTMDGDGSFDWDALVSLVIHPVQVAIVEAMAWIDEPLSAADLHRLFDDDAYYLSLIAYHMNKLYRAKALSLSKKQQVRGTQKKLYIVPDKMRR
jgi:hypothetical protein